MKEVFMTWYEAEKEKMAEMTKEQKKEYIIGYYGGHIVAAILILLLVIWMIYHFVFDNKQQGFTCAVVNCAIEESPVGISDELTKYLEYKPNRKTASFDTNYQISYENIVNEAADNSFFEKFFLNVRVSMIDVAIMPKSFMEYCNRVGHVFYDVDEVLTEEQIKKYESHFVTGTDDEGIKYICGIDVSDFRFFEKKGIQEVLANANEPLILSFAYGGKRIDDCRAFLSYLEQYEEERD